MQQDVAEPQGAAPAGVAHSQPLHSLRATTGRGARGSPRHHDMRTLLCEMPQLLDPAAQLAGGSDAETDGAQTDCCRQHEQPDLDLLCAQAAAGAAAAHWDAETKVGAFWAALIPSSLRRTAEPERAGWRCGAQRGPAHQSSQSPRSCAEAFMYLGRTRLATYNRPGHLPRGASRSS